MKKLVIACVASLIAASVTGAPLKENTFEIRIDGAYDLTATEDTSMIQPVFGLGYYFKDTWQAGGFMTFEKRIWESWWGVSDVWGVWGFVEKNFDNWSDKWVPCTSLSLGLLDGNDPESDNVFAAKLSGGVKYIFTEQAALSLLLDLDWAQEEIYDFERKSETTGSGKSTDFSINAGVRFFF